MPQEKEKIFVLRRIYIKDVSFESPRAPYIFNTEWRPKIDMQINNSHRQIEENIYESSLKITVTGKLEEKTSFLIEIIQAGLFHIVNMNTKEKKNVLEILCPTTLFPYAREHIDNLLSRASFPALMLAPINFEALYRKAREQGTQAKEEVPIDKKSIN